MNALQVSQIIGIIIILGLLVPLFLGIGMVSTGLRDLRAGRNARNWATVEGVVTTSGVIKDTKSSDSPMYTADVHYRYNIGGSEYNSSQFRYAPWTTSDKEQAIAEAAKYPLNSRVTVRYNPANPAASVVDPSTGSATTFTLAVGTGLIVMALILGPLAVITFLIPR